MRSAASTHVGARKQLVRPVLFEPNPPSCCSSAEAVGGMPGALVIEKGLFNRCGKRPLYVTWQAGCSSLLEPNAEVLKRYRVAPAFEIRQVVEVECARYDELHAAGVVPPPDVIKIDVQGVEYQVLEGFGDLLKHVLAVTLEAHFYQLYRGQRCIGDVVSYLDRMVWYCENCVNNAILTEMPSSSMPILQGGLTQSPHLHADCSIS